MGEWGRVGVELGWARGRAGQAGAPTPLLHRHWYEVVSKL